MLVPSYFHSVYRVLSPLVENIRSGCLPEQKLKLCKDAISYLVHHSLLQSLLLFIMSYRLWKCLGDNMKVLMWLQPTVVFFNFPYKDGASLFRFCNRYSWKLGRQAVGFVRLTMKCESLLELDMILVDKKKIVSYLTLTYAYLLSFYIR